MRLCLNIDCSPRVIFQLKCFELKFLSCIHVFNLFHLFCFVINFVFKNFLRGNEFIISLA